MTVLESNTLLTTVAITPTATSTKVHSYVRQRPVTSTSFQASQEESGRGEPNGRVSVQPTSFEGGLLVGLYDPHLGPQCAEYLQQHLVPILDESLSTQLDHSDDDHHPHQFSQQNNPDYRIDPNQVIDTLKSTFRELDDLLVATAITVALTQPNDTDLASAEELHKTQEVLAQVVTGSTALVGFLAPHHPSPSSVTTTTTCDGVVKSDFYLAQLGDSVAILAGLDASGEWSARRLNPPETEEHSVRYRGSDEYRKVVVEAKERALTAEQFLTTHASNGTPSQQSVLLTQHGFASQHQPSLPQQQQDEGEGEGGYESFLTRRGKFLGLPVTRAFGFLDWKIEQEPRASVATWVEKALRGRIEQTLQSGLEGTIASQEESGICNLDDPPYVVTDPKIVRFVLETASKGPGALAVSTPSGGGAGGGGAGARSDEVLVLLNRGFLYAPRSEESHNSSSNSGEKQNPYDQALISDFELSRIVSQALEREENAAQALAKALDQSRKDHLATLGASASASPDYFEGEGSILVIAL
ncbi:hypothetical protein BG006_010730 [Podila minutissima]|uniref:PPM-type phosphatase domain-containing protein n=1 Tax=Podila minutissima TaxID=64525 RepID=A0A9P5SR49_9FUNG|nr:hypothetical protein BG006_010730 [Podila minutissima]